MLTPETLPDVQRAIGDAGVDGWLLYDFRGCNPIAWAIAGIGGHITRRIVVWIPREGPPVAITHAIEQMVWTGWPQSFERRIYSSWRSLESELASLVRGKRVALEYSPGNAVPYLDRIPAGALEMIRAAGAELHTSADLVTRFYALWTPMQLAAHRRAAEHVGAIAREAMAFAGTSARNGSPTAEHELQARIMAAFDRVGLIAESAPNVSVGANAANPHYNPSPDNVQLITRGNVLLIDLWATEPGGIYADQTWMAVMGAPTERASSIWEAVRDARDAAIAMSVSRAESQSVVRGAEIDDAARAVIEARGFGKFFTHRTGHSIDSRDIHGSGPNLDNLETRDERRLIPGVGYSIEPGVYIPGEIGVRSEVNVYFGEGEAIVTPGEYQRDLLVV